MNEMTMGRHGIIKKNSLPEFAGRPEAVDFMLQSEGETHHFPIPQRRVQLSSKADAYWRHNTTRRSEKTDKRSEENR